MNTQNLNLTALFEKARAQAAFAISDREGMAAGRAINSHKWDVRVQGINIAERILKEELKNIVLIVRRPDYADDVYTYGEVTHIYLDLGSGFDITNFGQEDVEEAKDWLTGVEPELAGLPEDATELREVMQGVIDEVKEAIAEYDDGDEVEA